MEPRSRTILVFLFHVVPAVDDVERHSGECLPYIFGRFPFFWIFRVVVVAVERQAVRRDKIIDCPVAVTILCKDLIVAGGSFQLVCRCDDVLVGIACIERIIPAVCRINGDVFHSGVLLS